MSTPDARIAVVTGAARGIGAAVARRLAADGFGVAVLDLDERGAGAVASEIGRAGGRAGAFGVDVTDEHAVEEVVERVADRLGPPSVLVNNAGITRDNLLFKLTVDEWDSVLDVHLRGAFLLSRAAQRHMTAAGWGRIVNISSTAALGNRGQANYSTAKAGLQGLTKTLAIELGRFGITVNAIAPGFIQTDMTRATAERLGISFEEFANAVVKKIPVGRAGDPEDIAHLASFLVSEGAGYISGQVVYAAGGPVD
ncbi:SDR family NAD(P)-dependent oxidoreductase [Microbacterium betulae]|uniref:SDR family NAD(P)-dependent oxidoreductase n=1 Tax=Microbacterium betulae TaxID=2981139 RepID=A0AA97FHM3_9MICO|nr:SDR family NAD(P)-dependent oxidoreductase [Microbacterium sp. AB]WOF22848.1 SDR family NAD(P)-dependent oxidoreductase [Microbacterium sp. AB]